MQWFKHYNDASEGATLRSLWDSGDMDAYGLWWRLHEMFSKFEDDENRGVMTLSWHVVARETGWKPSKCRRVLARIVSVSKIELTELPDGNARFVQPNWLEYNKTHGGKRKASSVQVAGDLRLKNKEYRTKRDEDDALTESKSEIGESGKGGFDLEKIYAEYPTRTGSNRKTKGLTLLASQIKSEEDYARCLIAVRNYRAAREAEIRKSKDNEKYTQLFVTWCAKDNWPDWADFHPPAVGKPMDFELVKKKAMGGDDV